MEAATIAASLPGLHATSGRWLWWARAPARFGRLRRARSRRQHQRRRHTDGRRRECSFHHSSIVAEDPLSLLLLAATILFMFIRCA